MKTLSRAAQKALDASATKAGLPSLLLMEQAGSALARHIVARYAADTPVEIFCGRGNNGGDAYVAARLLWAEGFRPRVWEADQIAALESQAAGTDAGQMRAALLAVGLSPLDGAGFAEAYAERLTEKAAPLDVPYKAYMGEKSEKVEKTEKTEKTEKSENVEVQILLLDGLLGSGFRAERGLGGALGELCALIHRLCAWPDVRLIAIDIPSGVDADTGLCAAGALRAHETLSFVYPKSGCVTYPGRGHCGEIFCPQLGLSREFLARFWAAYSEKTLEWVDKCYARTLLPPRSFESHKAHFGRGLLLGGSKGLAGAIVLAARAAVQSGLGLTRALVEDALYAPCLAALPSVMWDVWPEREENAGAALAGALVGQDAVLVGPGMGRMDAGRQRALMEALGVCGLPLVLDADALNHLAADAPFMLRFFAARPAPTVVTPHPGEFRRLAPDLAGYSRLEQAGRLARRLSAVVVLKGAGTVVAAPDGGLWVNASGNDGLAKGGSGDVLSGVVTALLAQGLKAADAAVLGVYVHGLAADLAAVETGRRSLTPEQLAATLPLAFLCLEGVG